MSKLIFEKKDKLDYFSSEAFKRLRTNLLFSGTEVKVIAITSCIPNDGKSSICFHLAESLREAGKKVLYIDADLRKSVLIGRYRITGVDAGLSHYLSGQKNITDVIHETDISGFDMIVAGKVPPNPCELLGNEQFTKLLAYAKEHYDYVLIDTPPLGSVIDAAVIAPNCDGCILVIASNQISRKFAFSLKQQLEKTNCRILGAVLNKVNISKDGSYGQYYKKYYGAYE